MAIVVGRPQREVELGNQEAVNHDQRRPLLLNDQRNINEVAIRFFKNLAFTCNFLSLAIDVLDKKPYLYSDNVIKFFRAASITLIFSSFLASIAATTMSKKIKKFADLTKLENLPFVIAATTMIASGILETIVVSKPDLPTDTVDILIITAGLCNLASTMMLKPQNIGAASTAYRARLEQAANPMV